MLQATLKKNDRQAKWLIGIFSVVMFLAVALLGNVKLDISVPFDVHIFAAINAVINSIIALLLVAALLAVKQKRYKLHKQLMITALVLSVVFLASYVAHHLLAGEARYGDSNHDGEVSPAELAAVGSTRGIYFFILLTHILLASIILPFILYTAYKGLTAEFAQHKKMARYTWPLWLYVAISGPVVYLMISPYYQ